MYATIVLIIYFLSLANALRGPLVTSFCRNRGMHMQAGIEKPDIVYDVPVSNHGARIRMIIKAKGIEKSCLIQSPEALGGIKSTAYATINANGKMPALVTGQGYPIIESDTIARYIIDKYNEFRPSFKPPSLEQRTLSEQIIRTHDIYISPIQGCMYRATGTGFGPYRDDRRAAIEALLFQVNEIDKMLERFELYFDSIRMKEDVEQARKQESLNLVASVKGKVTGVKSESKDLQPYVRYEFLTGHEPSLADVTLYPTMVFIYWMLPRFFPQYNVESFRLRTWFDYMSQEMRFASEIKQEIEDALDEWEAAGRWAPIIEEVNTWG